MASTLFILTITCYLLSLVTTLTASFFARLIPSRPLNFLVVVHFILIISYLLVPGSENNPESPGSANYLFLAFFCSGILVSGVLLRKSYHLILKGYFSLFLISAVIFIVSPSRMLGFIASGKPDSFDPPRYHIFDNYYLVGQDRTSRNSTGNIAFKLVREMGFFHKTLARNIVLPSSTDSVRLLNYEQQNGMTVRVFHDSGSVTDSMEIKLNFIIERDSSSVITRGKPVKQP
jgi:hypothetical protein